MNFHIRNIYSQTLDNTSAALEGQVLKKFNSKWLSSLTEMSFDQIWISKISLEMPNWLLHVYIYSFEFFQSLRCLFKMKI